MFSTITVWPSSAARAATAATASAFRATASLPRSPREAGCRLTSVTPSSAKTSQVRT